MSDQPKPNNPDSPQASGWNWEMNPDSTEASSSAGSNWLPPSDSTGSGAINSGATNPSWGTATENPAPDNLTGSGFQQVQPGIIPLRPLTAGEIFNGAIQGVRQAPAVMLGAVIGIWAIFSTLSGLIIYLLFPAQLQSLESIGESTVDIDVIGTTLGYLEQSILSSIPSTIFNLIAVSLTTGLCVSAIASLVLGRVPSVGQAWDAAKKHLWKIIAYGVIIFVIETALILLALVPLITSILYTLGSPDSAGGLLTGALLTILLSLVCFISGVFLLVRFLFTVPIMVMEEAGLGQAFKRSWALTRGNFWRVLGINLLMVVLLSVIFGILSGALGTVMGLAYAVGHLYALLTAISVGVSMLISGFYVPFFSGIQSLLYIDIRMRREGLALTLLRASQSEAQ